VNGESSRQVRVLLVDDQPGLRACLRQIIEAMPGLSVCGEADTPASALRVMRTSVVDLAIVGLRLGPVNGLDLVRELHDIDPSMPILVLSMHDGMVAAERALRAGACGFLLKQQPHAPLIEAVQDVLAGHLYVSQDVMQEMLKGIFGSRD
jgi:DNA-binding NarL/FixJ family response regulator